jgi:hypothetical protein
MGYPLGQGGDAALPGILRDSKRVLGERSLPVYGSCARRTWREGSFTAKSESYVF